ncbi:MAG: ABC transporter permease [Chloroflexi bacterium]|jgi:peptide/nickel transport system permease protein|nr:ABC transporter permease [Chloroflexota bacterium]MBT4142328.1 ABC transporter permease [Chloroflexota bacterium]MBT4341975.1 ABC transporter permease [Chloroflexota bacterium]MBT4943680.1 ABC transporter permease [Chloroflexota bacterium]MBT5253082.1 ABC transporter permease [Chloroflexota bacterium]
MQKFFIRRLIFAILTLWSITFVVFGLSRMGPDPLLIYVRDDSYGISEETLDKLRTKWGLDRPFHIQYLRWMAAITRGDFGESIAAQRPVTKIIAERLPATLQLAMIAWILASIPGVGLGVLSAVKRGSMWDYFTRTLALIGQATPSFWLAILMILLVAVRLEWLPPATKAASTESFMTQASYFVLPAMVLGFDPWATYLRLTRSSMLEVLDSEFVKLARAKGVSGKSVIWRHALRNALIQPLTVSALVLASFITGSVFVETVFAWPGIGRLAVQASLDNDFPVLAGVVLLFGSAYVFMNFIADVLYAVIDPRIRYD